MKKTSKFRRVTCMILALASLFAVLVVPAAAISNDVHDILFDWEYYYANNPDLQKAFGKDPAALRKHFDEYGKKEGRAPSKLFDAKYYLDAYSDLKRAFGNDYTAAYNHFVNHGIGEGRQGSSQFAVAVYKANYEDLRKAFGGNNLQYLKHYREYGAAEGRQAVKSLTEAFSSTPTVSIKDGYYMITSGNYGWNVQYAPKSGIGNFVLDSVSNKENNEIFYICYVPAYKAYYITPVYRQNEAAANALYGKDCKVGSQMKLHPSNTSDTASLWYITQDGTAYRFQNVASGLYVTIGGTAATGTPLVLQKKQTFQQGFNLVSVSVSGSSSSNSSSSSAASSVSGLMFPLKGSITRSSDLKTNGFYCDYKTGGSVPVYAPADGTVVYKQTVHDGKLMSYGNWIEFTSADGVYVIRMAHLDSFNGVALTIPSTQTKKVSASAVSGEKTNDLATKTVSKGQLLGYTGQTGNASGHHLHLEVKKNGTAVNPTAVFTAWN